MARKSKTVTITTEGRDAGKSFLLTEMPVYKAEKWAARALLALSAVLGDNAPDALDGLGGLSGVTFSALTKIPFEKAEPLLDEMMTCVKVLPNPATPAVTRAIIPESDDIEELSTMLLLRKEIVDLHFDFFGSAGA